MQENEPTNKAAARAKRTYDIACMDENGEFYFGQPCGSWSILCVHGCGYIHLSSSTPGTRKKCCANDRMSINSNNCDSKLLANLELREFPLFMQQAVFLSPEFCHHSSTYNNLVAMGATKMCNYSERPGFENRGPGPFSVHLQEKLHHFFNLANSTNNSGRIGYFVFENESALAASASSCNLDSCIMDIIARGLREINPYSHQLCFLRLEAHQRADGVNKIPRVLNQWQLFDVCSVRNNQQTGEMLIQIKAHNDDVSSFKMTSEKVEPLFFLILFPLGEDGWTNDLKDCITVEEYVMWRLLMPEKYGSEYMTAHAAEPPFEILDHQTGHPFFPNENVSKIEENQIEGSTVCQILRTNRFMTMSRVAQYWLMDFYSRVCDQRLSIIGNIRNGIMMGQTRERSVELTDQEEEDRHAAGYTNPDIPKKESYLPGSAHGSPCHMAALARSALTLVSEWGCPHGFLMLTCNPRWPEILSQLHDGQTAFDCPDVTTAVFKSRLDLMKKNIRNGKYCGGREITYTFHVIEY